MRTKFVAVLDVRSAEVTAVVGERGVNNTFIIKSKYTASYDGYAEGDLLDIDSFVSAVGEVVRATLSSNRAVRNFYVGVPGEFLKLVNVDKGLGFQSVRRITDADVRELEENAAPPDDEKWKTIRHGCLYYVLSDKRKVIQPVGAVSENLHGKFCFYMCNRSFIHCVITAFKKFTEIADIRLIPTVHAEAMYLIEPEKRDECAVMFDLGYISSTYSVVCGNGLLYSESFSVGIGHVAYYLSTELDIPFDVALTFLSTVNLNAKERLAGTEECMYDGKLYSFSTATLRDKIREGLDGICETIEECRQNFGGANIEGKPLNVTGEGIKVVRGAAEHIAGRLVNGVELIFPKVPYYDKPQYGSLFSLLDTALNDVKSS